MYHYSSGKKLFILQSGANVSLKHLLARTDGVRGSSQRYARDMQGDRKRKKKDNSFGLSIFLSSFFISLRCKLESASPITLVVDVMARMYSFSFRINR